MVAAAGFKLLSKPAGPGQGAGGPAAARGAGGGGGGGGGGPGGGGAGRRASEVTPATIVERPFVDRLEVLGVAKGRESVTLTSNTSEMIDSVHFRPGEAVKRGQILVQLKSNEEDADILEARADVALAKSNAERWAELGKRGFAPQATVEQYQSTYERARASLAAAESRRGDRVIRAPFSGVIGLTDIAPGTLISPGTAIATLDDLSVIRVDFDIPDRYLPLVREGQGISASTDAYPGERYAGRIARIDTRIDERTRAVKARAEFPNPGARLKPGMLIRVGIDRGQRMALAAPESGVQFSGAGSYVLVIAKRGDATVAQQRPVITGLNQGGFVEIREGVQAGERIVADGLNRVQPNQPVRVSGEGGGRRAQGATGARPAASRP
jgi:membrane fusion protein (multidrug efflux system)